MAIGYIGEIRLVPYDFAPLGWSFCNGALLSIAENSALFSLIGTTYGGDGVQTFALPNLESRVIVHQGTNAGNGASYVLGQLDGLEAVTLTVSQIPQHNHSFSAGSSLGTTTSPDNAFIAQSPLGLGNVYGKTAGGTMPPQAIVPSGGSQPHDNLQPYLTLNYVIALEGIFPTRN